MSSTPPPNDGPDADHGTHVAEQQGEQPTQPNLRQTLYGLFFQPQVLLLLQQNHWGRAMRLVLFFSVIGGSLVGVARFPGVAKTTKDWGLWLGKTTQRIAYQDGQLSWAYPETLPYDTRHNGWKVSFRDQAFEWPGDAKKGPEKRGVVIAPTRVLAWQENERGVSVFPLFKEGQFINTISAERIWPQGFAFEEQEFPRLIKRLILAQCAILVVQNAVSLTVTVLFYTFLFALIPSLLRRSLIHNQGGFRRFFSFYLYAAVPATVVATIYGCLRLPVLQTSEVFVLSMVAYLLLVFRAMKSLFTPQT